MVLLPPSCALHPNADAVAFLGPRFHSWETYQNGSDYLGGEAYWAAGVDYVLRHVFNITVHFYNLSLLDGDDSSYWYKRPLSQYHRVVVDAVDTHRFLTEHRGSALRTVLPVRGVPATGRVALDDVHLASDGHERGDSGHRPESHRAPAGFFLAMKVQGRV